MLEQHLLDRVPGLPLLDRTLTDQAIVFAWSAVATAAACPLCHQQSPRIHRRYSRLPADFPWAARAVHFALQVRRFFCDTADFRRRIFAERFGLALRAYSRRTTTWAVRLQELGLTGGGAVGAALATLVATPISASTMLRLVRTADRPTLPTPRVLSLDDFALRKGPTYGTILVDLEQHYPVDLVPDRAPATVAAWLRKHPGVAIIARDRASGYAQAASDGAPPALPIADRYHLLVNRGDALQRLLDRHPAALKSVTEQWAQRAARTAAPAPPTGQQETVAESALLIVPVSSQPAERAGEPHDAQPQDCAAQAADSIASCDRPVLAVAQPTTASAVVKQRFPTVKERQARGSGQREIGRRLGVNGK